MKTEASQQALTGTNKQKDRQRILNLCIARHPKGVTIGYIEAYLQIPKATATARLSELQETGIVYGVRFPRDKYTTYLYEANKELRGLQAERYNKRNDKNLINRFLKRFGEQLKGGTINEIKQLLK